MDLNGILPSLPSAEEFEKLDRISRNQWRFLMARTFVADMGADVLRVILARGKDEWRHVMRPIAAKHSLKQEDVDWIFGYFQAEIRRRDQLVNDVRRVSRN